jgi:Family of unknown function (DUF6491)
MRRWTNNLAASAAAVAATLGLTLGFGASALARSADRAAEVNISVGDIAADAEQVDSFTLFHRPYSWTEVDEDTLILWATPFQPYVVELAFPAHDLRFTHAIGVTSVGSRVYAKFDSLKVRGFRYPIESIYKISREDARSWKRDSRSAHVLGEQRESVG